MITENPAAGSRLIPAVVLAAAVVLEVVFVLLFTPFLTVDAAAHIGSAAALLDTLGGFELGSRFIEWNPWPAPSIVGTLLLALAMPVVGDSWAETLVVLGYVVALPAATWYAVRASSASGWLALFALPLTFSLTFLWGFLSFSYSIVVFLVIAGFLLRTPVELPPRRAVGLALLLVLAFFCHFVGFLASGLLVLVVLSARAALTPAARRAVVRRGGLAVLPSAVLALVFVVSSDSASATSWGNPVRRLAGLVTLKTGIVSYDRLELVFCLIAAAALWTLIVVAVVRMLPWRDRDPDTLALAAFTVLVGAVAILAPDAVASGGSLLSRRLVLFPVLGVLLWLARQQLSARLLVGAGVAAVVAAGGLAVVRYDELRHVERAADDLAAITSCVEPGSTIVQGNLAYVSFGPGAVLDPHTSEAGRIAAARDGLDLGNIDWDVPFWLQRFRAAKNPPRHLVTEDRFVEDVPPPFDFASFEQSVGEPIDYILLWGRHEMTTETRRSAAWREVDRELRERYGLAVRSPLGWWELWSRAGQACAASVS